MKNAGRARDTESANGPTVEPAPSSSQFSLPGGYRDYYGLSGSGGGEHAFSSATSSTPSQIPHRQQMERSFGQDFSTVQAYTGRAGEMAALGAHAATRDEKVAFRESNPDVATVAHEMTHVVQSRSGAGAMRFKSEVSRPGDVAEVEADAVAERVTRGEEVEVQAGSGGGIHRLAWEELEELVAAVVPDEAAREGARLRLIEAVDAGALPGMSWGQARTILQNLLDESAAESVPKEHAFFDRYSKLTVDLRQLEDWKLHRYHNLPGGFEMPITAKEQEQILAELRDRGLEQRPVAATPGDPSQYPIDGLWAEDMIEEDVVKMPLYLNFNDGDLLYGIEDDRGYYRKALQKKFRRPEVYADDLNRQNNVGSKTKDTSDSASSWAKEYGDELANSDFAPDNRREPDQRSGKPNKVIRGACKQAIVHTVNRGRTIHFLLDRLDVEGIITKCRTGFTASELRYVFRNYNGTPGQEQIRFYMFGNEVPPPWHGRAQEMVNHYGKEQPVAKAAAETPPSSPARSPQQKQDDDAMDFESWQSQEFEDPMQM